jgi:hypothetical protein
MQKVGGKNGEMRVTCGQGAAAGGKGYAKRDGMGVGKPRDGGVEGVEGGWEVSGSLWN